MIFCQSKDVYKNWRWNSIYSVAFVVISMHYGLVSSVLLTLFASNDIGRSNIVFIYRAT